ncbi:UbiD family decarboxylase [Cryomorphaceae bacterium]|nr:UbiD family decarboxylase [Cryomorphaceae bacterium]
MGYKSLEQAIIDLERHGHLVRVKEEVDPNLEMAAIHLRVFEAGGPAILFERVKGSKFRAASNLFGSLDRSKFLFRHTLDAVQKVVELKGDPTLAFKRPLHYASAPFTGLTALPMKSMGPVPVAAHTCAVSKWPQIKHWSMDGGPFVTLPVVYTEDIDKPGVMNSNLGMYRIQLGGNDYVQDEEIGLHYQLHRGIGVHQTKANAKGQPLKVSIFVGGPPSLTLAGVMPLPEGLSELTFAGALGGRRFRYARKDGYTLASEADFVITGEVHPGENKPEGPFGDHLGYYSLKHPFPLMKVHKVFHRKNAIWPFTVVGRPPQEDTQFGALIHEITGPAIPNEIPGLREVNAVDAAGVHPLLLAVGSERYTPYLEKKRPQEILTIANHILGFGQLSLAKFLFIIDGADNPNLTTHHIAEFFAHVLERVDWTRDLHFHTKTSIDTLDYSGDGLNTGSKVVIAAAGAVKRSLGTERPSVDWGEEVRDVQVAQPGTLAVQLDSWKDYASAKEEIERLTARWSSADLRAFPLIVLVDDAPFAARTLNNYLWVTYTRSNPSHDIYGVGAVQENKHWGCTGPLVIDARIKTHHAPPVEKDPEVEKRVDALGASGGSLYGII